MKKNSKIFADFMKETESANTTVVTYNFAEQSFDVTLKTNMTVDDKSVFIDRVVNGCFDSNTEYRPEFRDAIFQITILQMLSDVPVFTKKMNELDEKGNEIEKKIDVIDIDKTYDLCKKLDLFHKANDAFRVLVNELVYLVETKLAFEQQRILVGEKKLLEKTKEEIISGVALVNAIGEKLSEGSKEIFDNVDINKVIDLSNRMNNMTDEEILRSITNK